MGNSRRLIRAIGNDVGHVRSIETVDRTGDGLEVDLIELRDGSFLELTCDQIRVWWNRDEYTEGRRPAHTMRIFPAPVEIEVPALPRFSR